MTDTVIDTSPIYLFNGDYAFLSNFYGGPIEYEGLSFPTVEHAYAATKSLDAMTRQRVRQCQTATAARVLGHTIRLRPDWEEIKVDVMTNLVTIKFSVDRYGEMLDDTGDRPLVHGSWYGYPGLEFWGVQLHGRPGVVESITWTGQNVLGDILESVREGRRAR